MPSQTTTPNSIEQDRTYVWHPFTPMDSWLAPDYEPVMISSGRGAELTDIHGKIYLDGNSSIWTNIHGHRHPKIDQALHRQLDKIAHSSYLGLGNPPASALAEKLASLVAPEKYRVFFSDNGSTAIECALKVAWQYFQQNGQPQRTEFVSLGSSYHGDTLGAMSLGKSGGFHAPYQRLMFPTHEAPSPNCLRCPRRQERPPQTAAHTACNCGDMRLGELETLLDRLGETTAALIMEPRIQGPAGMVMHPEGYLREAARLAKKHGAFLILDEIMTGFGRTGRMLASDHEQVRGDFIALAKGLTGGYLPLGATLVREDIFDGFRGKLDRAFFHGHSYCGKQMACAAALANFEVFEDEDEGVLERCRNLGDELHTASQTFWSIPEVADVRCEGLILAVELVTDTEQLTPFPMEERLAHRIGERARHLGLLTRGLGSILFLLPPLCCRPDQIRSMVKILFQATQEELATRRPC